MTVAFITGGANGIGAATVRQFIREGIKVLCFDRDAKAGRALQGEYSEEQCLFVPGDVRRVSELETAFRQCVEHFGGLDIIVANAGVYLHKSLLDTTEAEWDHLMDVNLKGVAFTVKTGLPYLIKQKSGSIILVASDQAIKPKTKSLAYAASKAAVAQMAKSLALDYGKYQIRANAVCPGTVKTPMTESLMADWAKKEFGGDTDALWAQIAQEYPLGRVGSPEEVAELIYFLSSDKASFMTASVYSVDGGLNA